MCEVVADHPEKAIALGNSKCGKAVGVAAARVKRAAVIAGTGGVLLWLAGNQDLGWVSLMWAHGVLVLVLWSLLQLLLGCSAVKAALQRFGGVLRAKVNRRQIGEMRVGIVTIAPLGATMVVRASLRNVCARRT